LGYGGGGDSGEDRQVVRLAGAREVEAELRVEGLDREAEDDDLELEPLEFVREISPDTRIVPLRMFGVVGVGRALVTEDPCQHQVYWTRHRTSSW